MLAKSRTEESNSRSCLKSETDKKVCWRDGKTRGNCIEKDGLTVIRKHTNGKCEVFQIIARDLWKLWKNWNLFSLPLPHSMIDYKEV